MKFNVKLYVTYKGIEAESEEEAKDIAYEKLKRDLERPLISVYEIFESKVEKLKEVL